MINELGWRQGWPVWVVFLAVLSQPFGVSYELFTLIMAVAGGFALWQQGRGIWQQPSIRYFSLLFLCLWLPGWVSLVDAVALKKGLITQVGLLRFYLAGIFVITHIRTASQHRLLLYLLAGMVLFWLLDAWVQAVAGADLLGRISDTQGRISGIFGKDPVLGWMLILYGALLVLVAGRIQAAWAVAAVALWVATVFISGNRGAWLALFWGSCAVALAVFFWRIKLPKRWLLGTLVLCAISIFASVQQNEVRARVGHSMQGIGQDYHQWDLATSYRLSLWQSTWAMIRDNPVNGVGVKSFRYAYPDYAREHSPFSATDKEGRPVGAHHAHQIVLEALAESGVFGLLGLAGFYILLFGTLFRQLLQRQEILPLAYFAGVVGVTFPLNTHLSLFTSYWAQAVWLLLAIFMAALFADAKRPCDKDNSCL